MQISCLISVKVVDLEYVGIGKLALKTYARNLQFVLAWSKHNVLYRGLTDEILNHAREGLSMYGVFTSNISDSETTLNPNFS